MTGRARPAATDELDLLDPKLKKLGILRTDDLLVHLPLRYEDETRLARIASPVYSTT